jgi:hypothetical protein
MKSNFIPASRNYDYNSYVKKVFYRNGFKRTPDWLRCQKDMLTEKVLARIDGYEFIWQYHCNHCGEHWYFFDKINTGEALAAHLDVMGVDPPPCRCGGNKELWGYGLTVDKLGD